MEENEIEHLRETVNKTVMNAGDMIWIKAFSKYFLDTGKRLGMGCSPCYAKVFYHITKEAALQKTWQQK